MSGRDRFTRSLKVKNNCLAILFLRIAEDHMLLACTTWTIVKMDGEAK